jgi:hypothetical protein
MSNFVNEGNVRNVLHAELQQIKQECAENCKLGILL